MDGLETEYSESVEFLQINASTPEGLEIFNSYSLFGHPSYLILDDTGKVLWQSVGEQPVENIEDALEIIIKN
ncbi:MAG: thioredoxin domain-containing protein [Planctomycetota bacterium]